MFLSWWIDDNTHLCSATGTYFGARILFCFILQFSQEATHPLPNPFSSGERSSAIVPRVDGASSHTNEDHTRQGLEQRAWMLLDNREPLDRGEANIHDDSLLPTGIGADSDFDLSPVRSNRYEQAARDAVHIQGLALATDAKIDATYGSTFRKKTISGLNGGESRTLSSEQRKKEATGDEGSDSRSLLFRKNFPRNRAAQPFMLGVCDEAFTCGSSTGQSEKRYDREMALSELTSATGTLLTGMDAVLRQFTEGEIPLGFDRDGLVNVPDVTDFRHRGRMKHASSVEPSWPVHSNFSLVTNRPEEHISTMTPSARGEKQDDSSVAALTFFAEDPKIVALVERAHEIEAELERRRYFGIEDGKQPL